MKSCTIEIRYRDGRLKRVATVADAKMVVQNDNETAIIEQVCTLKFCIAGKCITTGKKRKRRG